MFINKIQLLAKRYDQWAQVRKIQPVHTDESHTCSNCSTTYNGRFCPQCGLKASLSKLRIKNLILNFLDIWGMGSRPMFRTIRELFTRPGYMLREYLSGHQPLYFPPFKMLVVITVIFIISAWIRHANIDHSYSLISIFAEDTKLSPRALTIIDYCDKVLDWFEEHLAFAVIAVQLLSVIATRIAFRKCEVKWTLVELFFVHIYLACQYYILEIASIWLMGNDIDDAPGGALFGVISLLYIWLTYAQLYNLSFWRSLWYSILKAMWQAILIVVLFCLFIMLAFLL